MRPCVVARRFNAIYTLIARAIAIVMRRNCDSRTPRAHPTKNSKMFSSRRRQHLQFDQLITSSTSCTSTCTACACTTHVCIDHNQKKIICLQTLFKFILHTKYLILIKNINKLLNYINMTSYTCVVYTVHTFVSRFIHEQEDGLQDGIVTRTGSCLNTV